MELEPAVSGPRLRIRLNSHSLPYRKGRQRPGDAEWGFEAKQPQPRSTKDGSCLQKLEERPGMGLSLEPHGPSGTLTLNLTYLSFWVCSSSETLRQGDTDSSS